MKKITNDELEKLKLEQIELSKHIVYEDFDKDVRFVCGVDVSYWEENGVEYSACVAMVYDIHNKKVVEKATNYSIVTFPYISGFLSYREADIELSTIRKLKTKFDLLFVDGNGILHHRKAGEAVKLGIELNIPTIGVAKSYYMIDNIKYKEPDRYKGAYTDIKINDEILGRVVRTKTDGRYVFVSVGNKITLEDSVYWVLKLVDKKGFLPVILQLVDEETHNLRDKVRK